MDNIGERKATDISGLYLGISLDSFGKILKITMLAPISDQLIRISWIWTLELVLKKILALMIQKCV